MDRDHSLWNTASCYMCSASAGIFDSELVAECVQTCVGRVLFVLQNCVLASALFIGKCSSVLTCTPDFQQFNCLCDFGWQVLFGFDMHSRFPAVQLSV